jgi:hypothetical protein
MIFEEDPIFDNDYIIEDAAEMILDNIPDELRTKFDFEDIMMILEIIEEFYDQTVYKNIEVTKYTLLIPPELGAPIDLDEEKLKYHVMKNAADQGLIINDSEVSEILNAEMLYLDAIGWLRERDALYN